MIFWNWSLFLHFVENLTTYFWNFLESMIIFQHRHSVYTFVDYHFYQFSSLIRCFQVDYSNPANIRLDEDVFRTCWKPVEDVFSVTFVRLPRRLQNVLARRLLEDVLKKKSCKHVLKTSWRPLGRCLYDVLEDVLLHWRRLQEIFKTPWKTKNVCWELTRKILHES